MRIFLYIFWLLIIAVTVSLTVINANIVKLNLYFTTISPKLPVLLIATLFLGMVLGIIMMVPSYFKTKRLFKKQKKERKNLQKELNNLRKIPIKDQY